MKKFLLAGVALLSLGSAAAMAADLPSRRAAPAPYLAPAPVFTWTGFYIGAQGGGVAGGDFDFRGPGAAPITGQASVGGFVAGGQVGYNWQWGNVVFGIEGDVFYADYGNRLSLTVPGFGTGSVSARADGFGANATGRLGYAFGRTMVYAKGGWAYLDSVRFQAGGFGLGTASITTDMDGWTVGGGIEHALGDNASIFSNATLGVEYRYTQYDRKTINFGGVAPVGAAPVPVPVGVELNSHAVVGKLNWKFNSLFGL